MIDGKVMAQVELFNDGVSREMEGMLEKKSLISNLKKELKVYYECKMRQNEADFYKDKLDGESSVNKILFRAIDNL